jgi:multisubunit Na+/H+ antiporter MnhG subunit
MDIGEVISDAIKYPLSDWTKILTLGIILVIASIGSIVGTFMSNGILISVLGLIGFLVGLLGYGYPFRIIKSSLAGISELPEFDEFPNMFIDGIKVAIVGFIYSLPAILIILIFAATTILSILVNPSAAGIAASSIIGAGIGILIAGLYMLIIIPIIAMAIANMAYNDGELGAAFRFSELLDTIANIGWGDLIIWYIVTGIIYWIIGAIGGFITNLFGLISPAVTIVLMALIVTPFLQMYLARAVALAYSSQEMTHSSQESGTVSSK